MRRVGGPAASRGAADEWSLLQEARGSELAASRVSTSAVWGTPRERKNENFVIAWKFVLYLKSRARKGQERFHIAVVKAQLQADEVVTPVVAQDVDHPTEQPQSVQKFITQINPVA